MQSKKLRKDLATKGVILSLTLLLISTLGSVNLALAANPGDVVINEIMQNPSAVSDSAGEWFELYNPTVADIDINGWTIKDDDFDSHVITNDGSLVLPAGGYLVLARNGDSNVNGGVTVDYVYANFALANGADEVVLIDNNNVEIDRVEYDGGPNFPDPNGASMALKDPALDNNIGENWCTASTPFGDGDSGTPGAANDCGAPPPPPASKVTIMEIQGAGHVSPLVDQTIITTGTVTAVAFDGFYVQHPEGDGDDKTSDGLFVFMGSFCNGCPNVGDLVEMTDSVSEFIPGGADTGNLSITQMSFPDPLTVLSSGNPQPNPVVIGSSGRIPPNVITISDSELPVNLQDVPGTFNPAVDGIDFYESLEGMLVIVENPVAVSAIRTFGSFSSEFFTLPNNGEPPIIAPADVRTDRGGINLAADADGYGDTNPERVQIQFDASVGEEGQKGTLYPAKAPVVKVGDDLDDVTGVVGYSFGNFEVNAIEEITFNDGGLEPETTASNEAKKTVTVASYNVLNLSPLPEDDAQRGQLASQIVNNLKSPDVIALQEIQDNNGTQGGSDNTETDATITLQALVDAIASAGGPRYEFFDVAPEPNTSGGVPGGNIRNAFLYNADRVKLVDYVSLTPDALTGFGVSNPNAFDGTRDPLLATFKFSGKEFTVINNHLTSRFGSSPIFGGPQPFVQAGEREDEPEPGDPPGREDQTAALNEVVDALVAAGRGNKDNASKAGRVIVLGDLNTFEFTDDLTEILPGTGANKVLTNLISTLDDDNVYTFIFDGNSQVLDHFFVTDNLLNGAELDIVHVNVDFPRDNTAIVASDHEPLVGRIEIK